MLNRPFAEAQRIEQSALDFLTLSNDNSLITASTTASLFSVELQCIQSGCAKTS